MRHAVLITAHTSPAQVIELIDVMATPRSHVFVHVDRKSPFGSGDLLSGVSRPEQVTALEPSSRVHWGGQSYLKVIVRLLRAAASHGEFGYFHLLSGQCYPTMNPRDLFAFFEGNGNREYIEIFRLPSARWSGGGLNRLEYHHWYDVLDARRQIMNLPINRKLIETAVATERLIGLRRRLPGPFETFFGGSVFWSLTGKCVEYILGYLDRAPDLVPALKNTYCPEEILFQTLIGNSPHAERVADSSMRYIDWTFRNGNIPANLDEADFPRIVDSGALIARKIDMQRSGALIDLLRRRVDYSPT